MKSNIKYEIKLHTLAVDVGFQPLELGGEMTASSDTLDFESSLSSGGR
jgi:hypothetical protein